MMEKGGEIILRRDYVEEFIKSDPNVDIVSVLQEIMTWYDSSTGDTYDDIVKNTLESVVDIIVDYSEE